MLAVSTITHGTSKKLPSSDTPCTVSTLLWLSSLDGLQVWRMEEWLSPSFGSPVFGLNVESFGYNLLAVGGISQNASFNGRLWQYDVRSEHQHSGWEKLPSMPVPRSGFGTAVLYGNLFVVGGWDGNAQLSSMLCYNILRREWSATRPMQSPRYSLACAALRGLLYAVGGGTRINGHIVATAQVERFDPIRHCWEPLPPMRHARMSAACVAVNGRLMVIGGQDSDKVPLRVVEVYDPDTNMWSMGPELPEGRTACTACVLMN